jgi:hypothetical protein
MATSEMATSDVAIFCYYPIINDRKDRIVKIKLLKSTFINLFVFKNLK